MSEDLSRFIKELSEVYDPDNMDAYVSLYLNKNLDEKFIERRVKACKSVLKGDELRNFIDTMEEIKGVIKSKPRGDIVIFSSHKHDFLRYSSLDIGVENLLVVDSSPYLRPLARIQDEWELFTLLLISSSYAKIFSVSFIKKDGTERNMICRLGVQKYLTGGKNVNDPSKYLTVFDMQKKAYRNVALETIYRLRCKDVFIG